MPLLELLVKPDMSNVSKEEETVLLDNKAYDLMLYAAWLAQWLLLVAFLWSLQQPNLTWVEYAGRTLSMGVLTGAVGINTARELGHRNNKVERLMAQSLLLTAWYMHFFIEHNRGHHKNVGTYHDPATARRGESVYRFLIRCVWSSYWSAWQIENESRRKKGKKVHALGNQMWQFQVIQLVFLGLIIIVFSWQTALFFIISTVLGFLLLETIDYIEHYGLTRKEIAPGVYERTGMAHSWDASYPVGRLILFELSRHADHHYLASRKYQILRAQDKAHQMPTGYPGMILLSLIPPLWFRVMDRRI